MNTKDYTFQSCFATYLEQFINEKRSLGFIYNHREWELKHFDAFCVEEGITEPNLTNELIKKWGTLREGEALATCSDRTSALRQFAMFLVPLGIEAYVPSNFYKAEKTIAHMFSTEELKSFFENVDGYTPCIKASCFCRLALEYKVIYRLIACCGLRISEARQLRWIDVDCEKGTLRILQSKGRKDRLVYMAADLNELIKNYADVIHRQYNCYSDWVFPAREPSKCLSNGTLDKRFQIFWSMTPYSKNCDKNPTVHSFRYTFVVKRMNQWMSDRIPLKEMLPFLSKYLGHTSPSETFYYYHQVVEAFRIIRDRDKTGKRVIPEVNEDE